jgi:outer membrane protein OmpA-like peptidoglycan-associated protein
MTRPDYIKNMTAFCLVGLLSACATPARPAVLEEATNRIKGQDTSDLESVQPRLIREARQHEIDARRAYERGDLDRARLLAQLSIQRYETARNLIQRDANEQLAVVMSEANSGLDAEEARLAQQREELERYDDLEASFGRVQGDLAAERDAQQGAAALAARALLRARTRQSEAIAVGAPSSAPQEYSKGRSLLEAALEAHERRLHDEARASAEQATSAFDAAIAIAAQSPDAKRLAAQSAGQRRVEAQDAPEGPSAAQQAISRAEDARAAALSRGVSPADPRLVSPDYALKLAQQAAESGDDARATSKASAAAAGFSALNAMSAEATPQPAYGPVERRDGARGDGPRSRPEGLGQLKQTTCAGPWAEFEAMLQLAQERHAAGDHERAYEFAIRASERLKRCDVTSAAAVAPLSVVSSREDRQDAERASREDRGARDEAAVAIQRVRASLAVRKLDAPTDPRLREPTLLLTNAEQWFDKQLWAPAEAAAGDAQAMLKKIEDDERAARTAQPRPAASTVKQEVKPAAAKVDAKTQRAADPQLCERAEAAIAQADGAQLRASKADLSADEASYRRGVRLVERSRASLAGQDCDAALMFAEEADATFIALTAPRAVKQGEPKANTTDTTKTATQAASDPNAVRTRVQAEQDEARRASMAAESISRARLARARVVDKGDSAVFRTADNLLREADTRLSQGDAVLAATLAEQSVGAFASLEAGGADEQGADAAQWRPSYSQVIEALSARDEARDVPGAAAQPAYKRGQANLDRARRSWDGRDLFAAGKFADSAREDFAAAVAAAQAQKTEVQREQEADAKLAAEAKAKADREAEAKKTTAAVASRDKLRVQAEDALRAAKVQAELCERDACAARDAQGTIEARTALEGAQRELAQDQPSRALALANQARQGFEAALAEQRPFFIPSGVTRVTRVGDLLRLTPKISFSKATTLAPDTATTIDELSRVLIENAALIERVELIGFTDARGKRDANVKLSKDRAEAVRQELIRRGVSDATLSADGRGPDSPVADNKTAAGREQNRRVEVRVIFRTQQD